MATKFALGLWRGFRPAGQRSVGRGPGPRRRQASRVIESLEERVLLSADIEPDRPVAIVDCIRFSSLPPAEDVGHVENVESFESPSQPAGEDVASPVEDSTTVDAPPPDDGSEGDAPPPEQGPLEPPPIETPGVWPRGPRGNRTREAATSYMLVHDDYGNGVSSRDAWALASLASPDTPFGSDPPIFGPMPSIAAPSPAELAQAPKVAWSIEQSISGSMDGQDATVVVRIPVGPSTQTLTIGLKPEQSGLPFSPRIDQVFLLDRHGEVMTSVAGVSFLGDEAQQTLHLAIHGAPFGGEVVVRMITTRPPEPLESSGPADGAGDGEIGGDADPSAWGGDFELNIRRTESKAPTGSRADAFSPATGGISFVAWTRGEAVTAIGSLSSAPEKIVRVSEGGPGDVVASSAGESRPDLDVELADEGPIEVYLGPLVSRTAAAYGPALATNSDEPTTSTDRGGPGPGVLDAFGDDMNLEMILAVRARGGEIGDDEGGATTEADPALTALRGPGGVPIVVAGLRSGDRERDADALAASVVGSVDDAASLAEALEAQSPLDGTEPAVARAGLATRAVGFLIGMGLASGPLYPDLVALARKKLRIRPRQADRRRSRPA